MKEKAKRKAVQVKLSPDEMTTFETVKKLVNASSNSNAIRTMMTDEKILHLAANSQGKERASIVELLHQMWKTQGRPHMMQSMLQLKGNDGAVFDKISKNFSNLDDAVKGLLWSSANMTNNLNQVAHVVNIANQADPSDADTWQWVINALNSLLKASSQVQATAHLIQNYIKGTDPS